VVQATMIDSALALMSLGAFFKQQASVGESGLLSVLTQCAGIGVAVKDLDGRYQLTNTSMQTLVAKSAEQIVGVTDQDLFPPQIAAQLAPSDRAISHSLASAKVELDISVDGITRRCLWLKFPVLSSDGEILAVGALILDLSQQEAVVQSRQLLEQLQRTNQELQSTLAKLDLLASTDKLTCAWNRGGIRFVVRKERAHRGCL
jgi:PAS domain-containing protein